MKYRVLKRIKHNGKRYAVGESIDIENSVVSKRLSLLGAVIAEGVSETPETKTNQEPTEDDELTNDEVLAMIDDGFTLDEIKEELSNINLELPKSVKNKGDIIKFIIKKEMDEHFLDLLDDEAE